jgi:hypothetical protein
VKAFLLQSDFSVGVGFEEPMDLIKSHFNELLLSGLSLVFAGCAIWMLKHGAPDEGFKWAAGIVGTIVGALLMKMQVRVPGDGVASSATPNVEADLKQESGGIAAEG